MKSMLVFLTVTMLLLTGCSQSLIDSHTKEFEVMRGMAADAASRLESGGMGQMQVSGQGLNPGIKIEAGVTYHATARYDGLAGQFSVSSQGQLGDRIDTETVRAIINNAPDKATLADKVVEYLLRDKPANPPTTQPASK